jgi:hypothetical protein
MSELGRIVRVVVPAMLSLPIELAEAALAAPDGLERSLLGLIDGLQRARDELLAATRSLTAADLHDPGLDLDRIVEELLETERALAEVRERIQGLSAKFRDDIGRAAPGLLPLARRFRKVLDDICVDALVYLRDRRWDAMCVKAECAPREEPGEVIGTPEGVHAWFASLEDEA